MPVKWFAPARPGSEPFDPGLADDISPAGDLGGDEVTHGLGRRALRADAEEAELEVRLKSLQTELVAKQVEKTLLGRTTESREYALSRGRTRMQELRRGDADPTRRK